VSTEYIKFLATNSGSEKLEKMAESMICLKELTTKAAAKADTASTKVASLTADLTAAIRRVKALEDRARA
jgi:alpha-galactosidase/6-phospho-beta-glucosidase family protein